MSLKDDIETVKAHLAFLDVFTSAPAALSRIEAVLAVDDGPPRKWHGGSRRRGSD